jgi:hypothetical protein
MTWRTFGLGVLVGSLFVAVSADAAGPVVPKAVQRAVTQIFGSKPAKIEHEREGGADLYEAEGHTKLDVSFNARGTVEEFEVELPLGLVPPEVVAAARAALPKGAQIAESELVVRRGQLLYEIEGKSDRGEIELVIDAGGAVIREQVETDDDKDDD